MLNNNWFLFKSQGLPRSDESYNTVHFVDENVGYIGGHKTIILSSDSVNINFVDSAVLYKTNNQGRTWNEIKLGIAGSITNIFVFGDTINLLSQDSQTDSIYILSSVNQGNTWKKLFSTNTNNYIREIYFERAHNGQIIIEDSTNSYLVKYENNFWDTIKDLTNYGYKLEYLDNTVFSIIPYGAENSGVIINNLLDDSEKRIFFDKKYRVNDYFTSNNHFFISLQDKNSSKIMKINLDGNYEYIHLGKFEDYTIEKMYYNENVFSAIVYKDSDVGPIDVDMKFLISTDKGKTWNIENFPFSLVTNPAFLYQDQFFITNCGTNMFQIRKFK